MATCFFGNLRKESPWDILFPSSKRQKSDQNIYIVLVLHLLSVLGSSVSSLIFVASLPNCYCYDHFPFTLLFDTSGSTFWAGGGVSIYVFLAFCVSKLV